MFKYRFCRLGFRCNVHTKIFSFARMLFFNSNLHQKTN